MLRLLSMDFIKLIFIAIAIGLPVVWYAVTKFLEGYAYRITISIWIFLVPCLVLLFIAVFTVVTQTLKASGVNPVEALRDE
jgi:ABC-type antimicrobial peptide transport system permease subunit